MPTRLTDLVIDEVSLVDVPANPGARVVLFKRDASGEDTEDWPEPVRKALILTKQADYDRLPSTTKFDIYYALLEREAISL